jgi:hypothetical protein
VCSYIPSIGARYKKPTWVTEFAGSGSTAQQISFINTMIPWLQNVASVER